MAKPITERANLTCGQLARRWGVSVNRVRELVDAGGIPGVFVIPAQGRFGKVTKIPLSSVVAAERSWRHDGAEPDEDAARS